MPHRIVGPQSGAKEISPCELEQLSRVLADRLGLQQEENDAPVERYRTAIGRRRRRRRVRGPTGVDLDWGGPNTTRVRRQVVDPHGHETLQSETESEQSDIELDQEMKDHIVASSELYMERCEEAPTPLPDDHAWRGVSGFRHTERDRAFDRG